MVSLASWIAAIVYLIPYAFVFWIRARRDRPIFAIALDIPVVFVLDLLLILGASLFLRLEMAALVMRGGWVLGSLVHLLFRSRETSFGFPRAFGVRAIFVSLLGAALSLGISLAISRTYVIHDRDWHVPLVSSIRGQTLPFHNIFQTTEVLHYHFSGDVHAAILQTFSGGIINASFALSLSHDIAFGLLGLFVSLLLYEVVSRSLIKILLIEVAVVLCGPLTLGREVSRAPVEGYNFLNYLTMSFRPHDAIAGLLFAGFVGALCVRFKRAELGREGLVALLFTTAGLAITDEAAIGLLALSLGLVWLLDPNVIAKRRSVGVVFFFLMLVALIAPNFLFSAGLAPGAQRHAIAIVPWRSPGTYNPTLSLGSQRGIRVLVYDLLPTALIWLGGLWAFMRLRCSKGRGLVLLHSTLLLLSVLALTRIDINKTPLESHRFITGLLFVSPLLGAAILSRPDKTFFQRPGLRAVFLSFSRFASILLFVVGASLGAISTGDWILRNAPSKLPGVTGGFFTRENLYDIDCRRDMGARLGAISTYTYLDPSIWYAYAGCLPLYAPAHKNPPEVPWTININQPLFERAALAELHERIPTQSNLSLICPERRAEHLNRRSGPVCAHVRERYRCEKASFRVLVCSLNAEEREDVLSAVKP